MNVEKQALLFGQDITRYVTSWGTLERWKNMILGQDTLFVSEHTLEVANVRGWANLVGTGSVLKGVDWSGQSLVISFNGRTAFKGILIDVKPDPVRRVASIVAQNVLKKPAEQLIELTGNSQNPALAALAALRAAMPDEELDIPSFRSTASFYATARALVNVNFPAGSTSTVLAAVQKLTNLASFAIIENAGVLSCQPFAPYQGDEAGLRWDLVDALVREWSPEERDETAYTNRVSVGYPTANAVVADDKPSQRVNANVRDFTFGAEEEVVASNLTSASFFAKLYLARAALKRTKITAAVGAQAADARLGDRHPVSPTASGRTRLPTEVIGLIQDMDRNQTSLAVAQLA